LLPQALLRVSTRVEGDRIVPQFLTVHDEPWLRSLMDECAHFVGRKRTELRERLQEPLPTRAPRAKLRVAIQVLDALCRERTVSVVPPKEARTALFREAAAVRLPRGAIVSRVAETFGVTAAEMEGALFADLPGERRIAELPKGMSPARLATDANIAIVSSLVRRAAHVRIAVWGNSRALVRHARLMGLICRLSSAGPRALAAGPGGPHTLNTSREAPSDGVVLEVSGPFSLFRHTEVYGRALASLVPRMAWCNEYELTAACALGRGGHLSTLVLRSGDPIGTGRELARHDSRLEARFERDFRRAAPDWDVIREPRPVASGEALIFPDFELVHRRDKSRRWLLEIVGFWTQRYLTEKLERLRAAGIERLVLCIDQNRHCAEGDLPPDARTIRYKKRIDPQAVLAIVNR
jgi:predicted nuclease of restriction endonuclease-like RecB superfamily